MNSAPVIHRQGARRQSISRKNRPEPHPAKLFAKEWRRLFTAWRRVLARCASKPDRKSVHELRVTTLRLQALLARWQQTQGQQETKPIKKWSKQANKLRHALQLARTPEVYLRKLDWLRQQPTTGMKPEPDRLRQIAVLE